MVAPNKFNSTVNVMAQGGINYALDNLMVMLTNTLPLATNSVYGDVSGTELAPGNGYVTGGLQAMLVSSGQAAGLYKLVLSNVLWTATGIMGPFRYAIMYSSNTSIANRPLIGWWPYTSSLALAPTDTFGVQFSVGAGALQLQ